MIEVSCRSTVVQLLLLMVVVVVQLEGYGVRVSSLRFHRVGRGTTCYTVRHDKRLNRSLGGSIAGVYSTAEQDPNIEPAMRTPRIKEDRELLVAAIEEGGGVFDAAIEEEDDSPSAAHYGWFLIAKDDIHPGEVVISIPKSLCMYADPTSSEQTKQSESTVQLHQLMNSLQPHHWRMRLAIALLAERVKIDVDDDDDVAAAASSSSPSEHNTSSGGDSFYRRYIGNLPLEFRGSPLFFSPSEELLLLQDYSAIKQTRSRCRFLGEFASSVLLPLRRTGQGTDPFRGAVDVNTLGWGFICAASRAIRSLVKQKQQQTGRDVDEGETSVVVSLESPVLIPAVDLMGHSVHPNCVVVESSEDADGAYLVRALQPILAGDELTISYGPLSNDELLCDYGFTIDANPYDNIKIAVDELLLNTARSVMGQSNFSISVTETGGLEQRHGPQRPQRTTTTTRGGALFTQQCIPVGRSCDVLDLDWLHQWQQLWIRCITGSDSYHMHKLDITLGYCNNPSQPSLSSSASSTSSQSSSSSVMRRVDPRLLAVLRVLYSDSEEQLLEHGYDPFLLQHPGSMLSADREAHVVRTLIGIVAVILNGYGTDIERDLHLLHSHDDSSSSRSSSSSSSSSHSESGFTTQSTSVDTLMVKNDCLRQLRNIFSLPHINTLSPTIRKLSMATATADPASSSSSLHRPHPAEDELSGGTAGYLRKSTRSKYRDIDLTTAGDVAVVLYSSSSDA